MTALPSIDDPPCVERAADASSDRTVQGSLAFTAPSGDSATTTTTTTTIIAGAPIPAIDTAVQLQPQPQQQHHHYHQEQGLAQSKNEPQKLPTDGPAASTSFSPKTVHSPSSQQQDQYQHQESASWLQQLKGGHGPTQQQDPYLSFEAFFSVPTSPEERGMSFEEMLMANEAVAAAASAATAGDTYRSPTQDILLRPTSPYRRPFGMHSIPPSSPGSPASRTTTASARSTPQTPIVSSSSPSAAGPAPSSIVAAAASSTTNNTPTVSPGVSPMPIPSPRHHSRTSQEHDRDDPLHTPSSDPSSIKTILSSAGYFPGTSPEEIEEAALDYRLKGRSRASRGYSADFSTNNWTSALGIGSGHGPNQPGSPRSKSPARASRQDLLLQHHHHGGSSHPYPPSPGVASSSSQQDLSDHHAFSSHSSSTHHLAHATRPGHVGGRGRGALTPGSSTEELPLTEFLSKTAPPPPVPPKPSVYQLPEYPPNAYQGGPKASPSNTGRTSNESGARGSSSFQGPRILYAGFPNFRPPASPPPTDSFTISFSNQTAKIPITSVSGDFTGFQDYDPALEEALESHSSVRRSKRPSSKTTSPSVPPNTNSNQAGSSEATAAGSAADVSETAAGSSTLAPAVGTRVGDEDGENNDEDIWVRRYKVFPGRNVFLLRGRIMTSRDFPAFTVAVLLILVPTGLFHGFVSPYLWKHLDPAAPLVQAYLFIVAFSTMLKTSWTDPGVIPRGLDSDPPLDPPLDFDGSSSFYPPKALPRVKEIQVGMYTVRLKYCDTCRIYRPPRCSHCRQCDNCVEDEDHHCIWLNNCIGRRNYKYFWIFVTTAALYAFLTACLCLTHLLMLYNEKKDDDNRSFGRDAMGRAPVSAIVMLFAFVMGCAVGALAGYHYWLATMNRTTHEQLGASMMKPHEVDNPFDRGSVAKNCAAVLCRPPTKSYVRRRDYTLT